MYAGQLDMEKTIITSNLLSDISGAKYVISRNEIAYHDDLWSEDSTLMLLNILRAIAPKHVYIAGFDGFTNSNSNFYESGMERVINVNDIDVENRKKILKKCYSNMNIEFLTPSVYEEALK